MLYSIKIRKEIVAALYDFIIPSLEGDGVTLAHAGIPFQFPREIAPWKISDSKLTPTNYDLVKGGYPLWVNERLIEKDHPYLIFLYQGEIHKRIGVTVEDSAQASVGPGIYGISLTAPSAILLPKKVLHNTGGHVFWEDDQTPQQEAHMLCINLFPSKLYIHLSRDINGEHSTEQPLQIVDSHLTSLGNLFEEELGETPAIHQKYTQLTLLLFMVRLAKLIPHSFIANTYRPSRPSFLIKNKSSNKNYDLCNAAIDFIDLRLHERLDLKNIAINCGVSPQHLNRIFTKFIGVSVMKFITTQRVESAKALMLQRPDWPMQEIASLVGFENYMGFYKAFIRESGLSPRDFSKQHNILK